MTLKQQFYFWAAAALFFAALLLIFKAILLPFVLGLAIAYFLDPAADRLEKIGLGRTISVSFVLLVFAGVFVIALTFSLPLLQTQCLQLMDSLPAYAQKAQEAALPWIEKMHSKVLPGTGLDLKKEATNYAATALKWSGGLLKGLWDGGMAVFDILSVLIVTPVVAFYFLRDWDRLISKLDGWLPRASASTVRRLAREMDAAISGFVRGQALVCLSLGTVYALALSVTGLNFGFFIGFAAGILSFMPYVGSILGFVTAMVVGWFQYGGDAGALGLIAAVFALGQFLEGNFLTPKLVGDKVGLHAVWVLFALMAGGSLMGFTGVMIAVPVAAVLAVLVRFGLSEYLDSAYFHGEVGRKKHAS